MTTQLKAKCPHCSAEMRVHESLVGQRVRCPACKEPFEVDSVEIASEGSLERAPQATETMAPGKGSTANISVDGNRTKSSAKQESSVGKLGRFELKEVLGQGAFGRVYRAYDPQLDRFVALKVPTFGPRDTHKIQRFLAEAKAAARLRHPNIVPTYESGQIDGQYYIAAQFVAGETLSSRLQHAPPDFRRAAEWVRQLAEALAYAHREGIVHRDIKPDNIMLDEHDQPQIMDFGLAKRVNDDAAMTTDGSILGTPAYMSPEQAQGKRGEIGPTCDQYSLGVVLYELLSGQRAFEGQAHAVIARVISEEPCPIHALNAKVPHDLEAICQVAMSKDAKQRYPTCSQLAEDLALWLGGFETHARPLVFLERATRWCWNNPLTMATIGLVIFTLGMLSIGGPVWTVRESRLRRILKEQTELAQRHTKEAERQREIADWRLYASQIALAQRAIANHDFFLAEMHLETCRKEYRGWEYDYLYNLCRKSHQTLKGHTEHVTSVAFSPDGARIVSGTYDGTIKIWNATSGEESLTLQGHTSEVSSVAFSPDGNWIVSASIWDGTLKLWDATSGRAERTIERPGAGLSSVSFSPDGKRILSGSAGTVTVSAGWFGKSQTHGPGKNIKVWDLASGQEMPSIPGDTISVNCVAWSPDGTRIVGGGSGTTSVNKDGEESSYKDTLKVWDVLSGKEVLALDGHKGGVNSVAFSTDGKRIVSGSNDGTLKIWDATSGYETFTIQSHTEAVDSVVFSPDGKQIVAMFRRDGDGFGFGNKIRFWDAMSGREIRVLTVTPHTTRCVAFSSDGKRIACGAGATIEVCDAEDSQEPLTLRGHAEWVRRVAVSPDGKWIVSGSEDSTVRVWEASTGKETLALRGHTQGVTAVAYSPDGKRIVSGSEDMTIKVCDAASGEEKLTLRGHESIITSVAYSPNGKLITSGTWEGSLKVWNAANGEETLAIAAQGAPVFGIAFSLDSKRIFGGLYNVVDGSPDPSGGERAILRVWDASDGKEILAINRPNELACGVALSPDGKQIVSAGFGDIGSESPNLHSALTIYDALSGQEIRTLDGHLGGAVSVAFSPDGKRIVSGGTDATIRVWNAATSEPTLVLTGHNGWVTGVAFSPDGKRIVSAGTDKAIKIWDAGNAPQWRASAAIKDGPVPISNTVPADSERQKAVIPSPVENAGAGQSTNPPEEVAGPITNPANGHQYHLLSADTWEGAEARAVKLNGHLVTIDNQAEQDWVWSTFGSYGGEQHSLWIGLREVEREGNFQWVSGAPRAYTHWEPREPNNGFGVEAYVHMLRGIGRWNDIASPPIADVAKFGPHYGVVEVGPQGNSPANPPRVSSSSPPSLSPRDMELEKTKQRSAELGAPQPQPLPPGYGERPKVP